MLHVEKETVYHTPDEVGSFCYNIVVTITMLCVCMTISDSQIQEDLSVWACNHNSYANYDIGIVVIKRHYGYM